MSEEMQGFFIDTELPEVFEKHGLTSSFLVNFWKDFTMISIILSLAVIFIVLENITKSSNSPLFNVSSNVCELFSNGTSSLFSLQCAWMTLCFTLLFNSAHYKALLILPKISLYIAFSFLSTLAAIFFSLGLIWVGFFFIHTTRAKTEDIEAKSSLFNNADFLKKCQDFQVLFQGYNPSSLWTHSFYLIYVIRVCYLPMLIASYLYQYPLPQTILQVGISLVILGYLLFMRPLQNKVNNVQLIISESLVLIMNGCLLALKCLDIGDISEKSFTAVLLGDFIIGGNELFNVTWVIFLWIKLLNEAREIYKYIKVQQIKERAIWIELLVMLVQQGGMGFEEIRIRQIIDVENTWVDDAEVSKADLLKENEENDVKEDEEKVEEVKEKPLEDEVISFRTLNSKRMRRDLLRNSQGIMLDDAMRANLRDRGEIDELEMRVHYGQPLGHWEKKMKEK